MTFKEIEYRGTDWEAAVKLREKVLREPLGSKFTTRELQEEKDHIHIAGFVDNELVATAVLVPEGDKMKMQRVAVAESHRNRKIGSQLIKFCEALALKNNVKLMYCHARDRAVNFYNQNNYLGEGDYFNEDGIQHLKMIKLL